MIIQFKIFENKKEPEIDDWVLAIDNDQFDNHELNNFLLTNAGQIINLDKNSFGDILYVVYYKNKNYIVYDSFYGENTKVFLRDEIIEWSKNKEELEHIIAANKYNL